MPCGILMYTDTFCSGASLCRCFEVPPPLPSLPLPSCRVFERAWSGTYWDFFFFMKNLQHFGSRIFFPSLLEILDNSKEKAEGNRKPHLLMFHRNASNISLACLSPIRRFGSETNIAKENCHSLGERLALLSQINHIN